MSYITMLFISTLLDLEQIKYSYGRTITKEYLETLIKLPILRNHSGEPVKDCTFKYSEKGYIPDWEFMENYIKSLHHKPLTTKNRKGQAPDLRVCEWGEFRIDKIFTKIESGKVSQAGELESGDEIPYLGAKKENNGVMSWCIKEPKKISKGNCVIMICDGAGSVGLANYMDVDFMETVNLALGYNEKVMNQYIGLFLATILSKERAKYSFGRKWKPKLAITFIKLPIKQNKNGEPIIDEEYRYSDKGYVPDWQFMEDYIKSLPYGDRLEG